MIAALSPEVGEGLIRLGYSEPCELRTLPSARTLAALRRSKHWRRYSGLITSDTPGDVWRELCWRYVVYPGRLDGQAGRSSSRSSCSTGGPPFRSRSSMP